MLLLGKDFVFDVIHYIVNVTIMSELICYHGYVDLANIFDESDLKVVIFCNVLIIKFKPLKLCDHERSCYKLLHIAISNNIMWLCNITCHRSRS